MKHKKEVTKKVVRVRPARLTIDCSVEQKRKIKLLAASSDKTITDFILELVEEKFTWCPLNLSHVPNAKTKASIESSEQGKGIKRFESINNLLKDLDN